MSRVWRDHCPERSDPATCGTIAFSGGETAVGSEVERHLRDETLPRVGERMPAPYLPITVSSGIVVHRRDTVTRCTVRSTGDILCQYETSLISPKRASLMWW
jgi:hypothetical protein